MLKQYQINGTYYGWDSDTGHLVAFATPQQLLQYFPEGIDPLATTLPSTVSPNRANLNPGQLVNLNPSITIGAPSTSTGISQETFNKYINNPTMLALFTHALVYGGYTVEDIYRYIKGKEMGLDIKAFDSNIHASQFYQTADYAKAKNSVQLDLAIPDGVDPQLFNSPLFAIPDEAFQTLVAAIDINSPQFKEEASKIQDAYSDLLLQQLNATTNQAKTIADDNYRIFKDQIQKKYGIALADSASAAWGQVQQLTSGFAERGLADSGIMNEVLDRFIADRRKADQRLRDQRITDEEAQRRQYYLTKATPDQIKNDLTDEERERWGLKPTQETLDFINNLKKTYPDLTDDQIARIRNTLVDPNGNRRSELYYNLYTNRFKTEQEKQVGQEATLLNKKILETAKAYEPYTQTALGTAESFLRSFGEKIPSSIPPAASTPTPTPVTPPATPSTPSAQPTPATTTGPDYNFENDPSKYVKIEGVTYASADVAKQQGKTVSGQASPPATAPANVPRNFVGPLAPGQTYEPSPTPQPPKTIPGPTDLTSRYGLYKGTVYDLSTGLGFAKPEEFFQASGVKDFGNVKFKTDYVPTFYKYDQPYQGRAAETVYLGLNNQPLDYQSYLRAGGDPSFKNIQRRPLPGS